MKKTTTRRSARLLLLLIGLPIGCLMIQRGEAEPLAAAAPAPTLVSSFTPPFGNATIPVQNVTAPAEGGIFVLPSGMEIAIPELAFVDANGQAVLAPVELSVREFHNPIETWLGGVPMTTGRDHVLRSAGMLEIRATVDGNEVELAPGKRLQLNWFSVDEDPSYVSWVLDTASGEWSRTGERNETQLRDLEAELSAAEAQLPPRVNPVVPNRHSFDIGDLTGNQPGLAKYGGVQFVPIDGEPCGHDATRIEVDPITDGSGGTFLVRFIIDTVLTGRFKASSTDTLTYTSAVPLYKVTECPCHLGLPPGADPRLAARINRLLNGDSDRQRERGRRKALALWNEYRDGIDRQFLTDALRPSSLPDRPDRPGRITERSMDVDRLGWINCDIEIPYPTDVDLMADFIGPDGGPLDIQNLAVLELDTRTLYPCNGGRIRLDPTKRNAVFGYTDGHLAYLTKAQIANLHNSMLPMPITPRLSLIPSNPWAATAIINTIIGTL